MKRPINLLIDQQFKAIEARRTLSLAKFYVIGVIVANLVLLACFCAHADDKCQDPSKLSPKMKKAYYQLKKAGLDVSIRCNPVKTTQTRRGK